MTIGPGTRLGFYEITAKLGEGGMGKVYRATDTKPKREVAMPDGDRFLVLEPVSDAAALHQPLMLMAPL